MTYELSPIDGVYIDELLAISSRWGIDELLLSAGDGVLMNYLISGQYQLSAVDEVLMKHLLSAVDKILMNY